MNAGRDHILWALETADAVRKAGEIRGYYFWAERLSSVRYKWQDERVVRIDFNDKQYRPIYAKAEFNDRELSKMEQLDSYHSYHVSEGEEDDDDDEYGMPQ